MFWRRRSLTLGLPKPIQKSGHWRCSWSPGLADLGDRALSVAPESVRTVDTDASGTGELGATMGDLFAQGRCPPAAEIEGIDWEE